VSARPPRAQQGSTSDADRFYALIYDYRYLSLSGHAWKRFGPDGRRQDQVAANQLLPGIGVLIQDSLLLHARSLIDFYTKTPAPNSTDIVLANFQLPPVADPLRSLLKGYKQPIEVHLLHLTDWRDVAYRTAERATSDGKKRQRPDWNRENAQLVELLLRALNRVSRSSANPWTEPFQHLHRTARAVVDGAAADLPEELLEHDDVFDYLRPFGLA
jgi:hypothetical protein